MAHRLFPVIASVCVAVSAQTVKERGSASVASEPSASPPSVGIVLRFERKPAAGFVSRLREEVEHIFRPAGLHFRWENPDAPVSQHDRVVLVEMRGICSSTRMYDFTNLPPTDAPLGWTMVADGEVIPHSVVDCDQVARAAWQTRTALFNSSSAHPMFGRLAARVLAHELMHALLRTRHHADTGVTSEHLRLASLQAEVRLKPTEIAALLKLGRASSAVTLTRRGRTTPGAAYPGPSK